MPQNSTPWISISSANSESTAAACCCNIMPLRSFYIACSPKFGEDLITSEYPCNAEKLNFSAATTFDARLRTNCVSSRRLGVRLCYCIGVPDTPSSPLGPCGVESINAPPTEVTSFLQKRDQWDHDQPVLVQHNIRGHNHVTKTAEISAQKLDGNEVVLITISSMFKMGASSSTLNKNWT
jgi:hypothetical protein